MNFLVCFQQDHCYYPVHASNNDFRGYKGDRFSTTFVSELGKLALRQKKNVYHQPILSLVPLILHPTLSLLALNLHPKRSPGEPWRVSRRVLIVVSLANCDLLGYPKPRLHLSFISRPSAVLCINLRLFFTLLISTITGTSLLLSAYGHRGQYPSLHLEDVYCTL